MKQAKICLAAIMVVAMSLMGLASAQEEKEKKEPDEQKKPRLTITSAPEGAKVTIIEHERTGPVQEETTTVPRREMTAEEQAWFEAGLPGDEHQNLKQMVGRWEVKVRYFPSPDAQPQEGRGSALKEMVLGGRFLQTTYKGEWMGETFIGMGFEGYDNIKKKHTSLWMDNTGTMTYLAEGTADETGKIFTYYGEYLDPAGKLKKSKSVVTIRSLSMHTVESFDQNEKGEWVKVMDIVYGSVGMR